MKKLLTQIRIKLLTQIMTKKLRRGGAFLLALYCDFALLSYPEAVEIFFLHRNPLLLEALQHTLSVAESMRRRCSSGEMSENIARS